MLSLWIDIGDGNGPVQNPALTQDEFDAGVAELKAQNLQFLYDIAFRYQDTRFGQSGSHKLAIGIVKGGPVAKSIDTWIDSVWALYYQRKPLITEKWDDALFDFTSCGEPPHTFTELVAEVDG